MGWDDAFQAVFLVVFVLACITFVIYAPLWAILAVVIKVMWNGFE